jgi:hypothetical protein
MNSKKLNGIVIAISIGLFVASCSKRTTDQVTHPTSLPPNTKDLGIVELKNNESHQYDLGDGKDCIVTISTTPPPENSLIIDFVIEAKDASGNKQQISNPKVSVSPGHAVLVISGDTSIKLMPKLKVN